MKLYIVSEKPVLDRNSGFIELITESHEKAHESAPVGHYVHIVNVERTCVMINAGKMLVGYTPEG